MRLPSHRHWFLEDQFPRARHRRPDNRLRQGADRAPAGYRSATFLGRLEAGGDAAVSVLLNPVGRVPQVRHRRAWRQVKSGHGPLRRPVIPGHHGKNQALMLAFPRRMNQTINEGVLYDSCSQAPAGTGAKVAAGLARGTVLVLKPEVRLVVIPKQHIT